ncbi:60S ribosomal protein L7 [Cucumispora dikerogammari]|nr:60S ribosomal protein L7 [Cucumispora dikerogammari]
MQSTSTNNPPHSFTIQQEYQQKQQALLKAQQTKHLQTKLNNEAYAETKTLSLINDYKTHLSNQELLKSTAIDNNSLFIEGEANFIIVILIRSINRMPRRLKKILQLFRLKKINNAVIIKNNKSNKSMIQLIHSYIAFGTLNIKNLRELFYKRGYGRKPSLTPSKGFRDLKTENIINLTNENIINHFNNKLKCLEELIDVIYFGREEMKEVINFLSPFQLTPPRGGFKGNKKKIVDVCQGGYTGNHGEYLERLIMRMI